MLAAPAASSCPTPQRGPVLDADSLQRLQALDPQGSNRVVERVLRAYEASLQRLLPQAVQAARDGEPDALRHVAHTLKSSSASVGALQLSRQCAEVESRLRAQRQDRADGSSGLEDLDVLLAELQAEAAQVLDAVRALLADGAER